MNGEELNKIVMRMQSHCQDLYYTLVELCAFNKCQHDMYSVKHPGGDFELAPFQAPSSIGTCVQMAKQLAIEIKAQREIKAKMYDEYMDADSFIYNRMIYLAKDAECQVINIKNELQVK